MPPPMIDAALRAEASTPGCRRSCRESRGSGRWSRHSAGRCRRAARSRCRPAHERRRLVSPRARRARGSRLTRPDPDRTRSADTCRPAPAQDREQSVLDGIAAHSVAWPPSPTTGSHGPCGPWQQRGDAEAGARTEHRDRRRRRAPTPAPTGLERPRAASCGVASASAAKSFRTTSRSRPRSRCSAAIENDPLRFVRATESPETGPAMASAHDSGRGRPRSSR